MIGKNIMLHTRSKSDKESLFLLHSQLKVRKKYFALSRKTTLNEFYVLIMINTNSCLGNKPFQAIFATNTF